MKLLSSLLFILFFSTTLLAQKGDDSVAKASALIDQHKFSEAYGVLYQAKEKYSRNSNIYSQFARLMVEARPYYWYINMRYLPFYASKADTAEGIKKGEYIFDYDLKFYLTEALKHNDKNALAYELRSVFYTSQKEYDKAEKDIAKALELDPNNCHIYFTRGSFYRYKEKWDSAIADFNRYIECDKNNAMAYARRSIAYTGVKKWEEALADIQQAALLHPAFKDVYTIEIFIRHNLAVESGKTEKFDEAILAGKKAVQKFPDDLSIYKSLNEIYVNRIRSFSKPLATVVSAIYKNDIQAAIAGVALITNKADLDVTFPNFGKNRKDDRLITAAVDLNSYELASALLKAGANPDLASDGNESSLHLIGKKKEIDDESASKLTQLLFQYNANPNVKDRAGKTPLYDAIVYERTSMIRELVNHKINVNATDMYGHPAFTSIRSGTQTCFIQAKLLIDAGADMNIASDSNYAFSNASFNLPHSLLLVYLMVKAGLKPVYQVKKREYAELKTYVNLLQKEVIGKPTSDLFEHMILLRTAQFKETLLKTKPSDSLINYLYLANAGGPYNVAISTALREEGAADNFSMYSPYSEKYESVETILAAKFRKPTASDAYNARYFLEMEQLEQLLLQFKNNSDLLNASIYRGLHDCSYLADNYNIYVKVVRFYNKVIANHTNGSFKLSDERLKLQIKTRDNGRAKLTYLKNDLDKLGGCGAVRLDVE